MALDRTQKLCATLFIVGKRGPKPKPLRQRRHITRSCRLRPDEAALIERAAKVRGLPVTRYMRDVLVRSAQRTVGRKKVSR
jgi:uncharacterized protein (DUF1778 family)